MEQHHIQLLLHNIIPHNRSNIFQKHLTNKCPTLHNNNHRTTKMEIQTLTNYIRYIWTTLRDRRNNRLKSRSMEIRHH